jgi:hypothetical protein
MNVSLRHDLYFDSGLHFKPNTLSDEDDPEDSIDLAQSSKSDKKARYWSLVSQEVKGTPFSTTNSDDEDDSHGSLWRLPLLLFEVRGILEELLPCERGMRERLREALDVGLLASRESSLPHSTNVLYFFFKKMGIS